MSTEVRAHLCGGGHRQFWNLLVVNCLPPLLLLLLALFRLNLLIWRRTCGILKVKLCAQSTMSLAFQDLPLPERSLGH